MLMSRLEKIIDLAMDIQEHVLILNCVRVYRIMYS